MSLKGKCYSDGPIKKFKEMLVLKGYYLRETYSFMAKFTSIKIILDVIAFYDFHI